MKPISELAERLRATVGLPLVGSLILLAVPAMAIELDVDNGLISIDAKEVAVQEILDALVATHRLRLVQQNPLLRKISIRMEREPLSVVLEHLLESSDSYQLFLPPQEYADDEGRGAPAVLWLFTEGRDDAYVIEFLETVLLRGNVGDRKGAVRDLRDIGTPAAVQSLSFALGDDDERVKNAALEALTTIGSDEAMLALASSLGAQQPQARAAATEAVAAAGGDAAMAYLDVALTDADPRVRMAAADALGQLGGEAARVRLRSALADPDGEVRERAVEVLEALDDDAMFQALFPAE